MKPRNLPASVAALALAASTSTPSVGAVYTYNFTFNPTAATCATAGDVHYCETLYAVTPPTDNPGDQYNINVTLTSRVTVPGSATHSEFLDGFYDSTAGYVNPPLNALQSSTSTVLGYVGPPGLSTSGTYYADGYYGFAQLIGPNPGFSLTGMDSTITVGTQDAYPLAGAVVSYFETVPEPATWAMTLLGAGLVGAGMRLARRKDSMAQTAT
jgi:hypothetical protein